MFISLLFDQTAGIRGKRLDRQLKPVICHLSSALCPLSSIFGIHNRIDDFNCRQGTGNIMNPYDVGTVKYGGCHGSSGAGLNDGKIRLQVLVMPIL